MCVCVCMCGVCACVYLNNNSWMIFIEDKDMPKIKSIQEVAYWGEGSG